MEICVFKSYVHMSDLNIWNAYICILSSVNTLLSLSPSGWYCQSHGQKGHEGLSEALLLSY